MITNTSITLYNRYVVSGAEKYQRTVISAVAFEQRLASRSNLSDNTARVFIPHDLGTNYLDPIPWLALAVKTGKWTLNEGDVIVKGTVTDEIVAAVISPPSPAVTMTNLQAKYDFIFTIVSVSSMDAGSSRMHHWDVGLK